MEQQQTNAGQGLGVAGLVIGIISFILAFIPCIGLLAIIPAVLAIVLAAIGMNQARRGNSPKGLMIGGLVVAIIALLIAVSQILFGVFVARQGGGIGTRFEEFIEEIETDLERDLDRDFSITVETDEESVRIENRNKEKNLESLEELEKVEKDTTRGLNEKKP